ncbi:MAG: hypothetical protein ACRD15_16900 [Vicinamibacterales bacterium]
MPLVFASAPGQKLLQSTRVKLLIAVLSSVVLGAGSFLKPQGPPPALSASQEHSAPLLEEEIRRSPAQERTGD